ncbi:MAG: NADH-quinone oxidoreductase subunit D [Anaerolineae bacterium]
MSVQILQTERGLRTDTIEINMGPHHPSTHGVFRMVLTLDGETVVDLEPRFGYLHRGIEKTAEERTYVQNVLFTDRLDYICGITNNWAYALALEKLAGIEVPERAEYIRVILGELTRVMNHMLAIGFLWNDLGATTFTPVVYAFRERERILDLIEMAAGSRMMPSYIRAGGVVADLPEEFMPRLQKLVPHLWRFIDEMDTMLTKNEIFRARAVGVGVLKAKDAINAGISGPVLRASGVKYDIRKADSYSIYDRFDFEVPVHTAGDVYARYLQRLAEARQSLRIIEQAMRDIPEGPVTSLPYKQLSRLKPPAGEAYGRIESPKGELGFYLVSDGSTKPYRFRIRSTSLLNLTLLKEMCIGHKVADVVTILGSIDITLGDVDR